MFLTMFFKTQNIGQTMHLTMLIAHPYCHDHGVKREYQEESRHNSSKRTKVEVKAKVKEEVDDGTISNL